MASLFSLPREIRDEIWSYVFQETNHFGYPWSSCGYYGGKKIDSGRGFSSRPVHHRGVLQASRQILIEVSPFFYEIVCVTIEHTSQTLQWLQTIGPRNSACIRHLVIRYSSLIIEYSEDKCVEDRELAWTAALRCMPNLLSLTFDFKHDPTPPAARTYYEADVLANDVAIIDSLSSSAAAWSRVLDVTGGKRRIPNFHYRPMRPPSRAHYQDVIAAFIAIDEELPQSLGRAFTNLKINDQKTTLDLPVTGLSRELFKNEDFELACTYAFKDRTDQCSIILTYHKIPRVPIRASAEDLGFILSGLPLEYLRIGCRNIDSKVLFGMPPMAEDLKTLDVAFTDANPGQVVIFLRIAHRRCKRLRKLNIAVSPLHDRDPHDQITKKAFERNDVSSEIANKWRPFWNRLDDIAASGVIVWEGEGPEDRSVVGSSIT